jgi:hypothetical protein
MVEGEYEQDMLAGKGRKLSIWIKTPIFLPHIPLETIAI